MREKTKQEKEIRKLRNIIQKKNEGLAMAAFLGVCLLILAVTCLIKGMDNIDIHDIGEVICKGHNLTIDKEKSHFTYGDREKGIENKMMIYCKQKERVKSIEDGYLVMGEE